MIIKKMDSKQEEIAELTALLKGRLIPYQWRKHDYQVYTIHRAQRRVVQSNGWKSRHGKSQSQVAWMAGTTKGLLTKLNNSETMRLWGERLMRTTSGSSDDVQSGTISYCG